jgi:hypothetical protein
LPEAHKAEIRLAAVLEDSVELGGEVNSPKTETLEGVRTIKVSSTFSLTVHFAHFGTNDTVGFVQVRLLHTKLFPFPQ